jgi:hypothetical protein
MSPHERARVANRARQAALSPERRKEIASKAHLASAVKVVVDRAPELSEDQTAILRRVFCGGASA